MATRHLTTPVDADALGRELSRRGLSKSELAERAGISVHTVSAIFAGEPVRVSTLRRVSDVLESIPPSRAIVRLIPKESA